MNIMNKLLDVTFWKFVLVGILNTAFGTIIMFVFYNFLHFSYWVSSASNYIFGSILSYFLNKHFTFKNTEKGFKVIIRFVINISICYFLAYGIARPLVSLLFSNISIRYTDNIAMFAGMFLFMIFNYFGQRFLVFKK